MSLFVILSLGYTSAGCVAVGSMQFDADDQEVFEINDFTTATSWERFTAALEEVIYEWKLSEVQRPKNIAKGELVTGKWIETRTDISYGNFQFSVTRHQLQTYDGETIESEWQPFFVDSKHDFPSRAHCLVRWYGIIDFLVIEHMGAENAVDSETRAKLLLSSAFIALQNSNCHLPIFIQLYDKKQRYFLGVGKSGNIRTDYEMVKLSQAPKDCLHIAGLIDIFKGKISPPMPLPSVTASIRLTYIQTNFEDPEWCPNYPDLDSRLSEALRSLPMGALSNPMKELHLSATWYSVHAEDVWDIEGHTDLNPVKVGKKGSDYSGLLGRLTEPLPSLSSVLETAHQKFLRPALFQMDSQGPLPTNILMPILLYLFPDADEAQTRLGSMKSSPESSIVWRLALAMAHLAASSRSLVRVAHMWQEFILELRYRWEHNMLIPG
ncbi:unnamed protein product [Darwinula stevensoni]|uniref:Rab3 GTPase-activating protein catalytic subunit n=1 Tax=Darwinula stevensoni TaxID=69355 RepID=A0A7R8X5K8_9CRUS|nr:unnamed protein product [Darwinula stevensoni]CAG0880214.1 unnamed protein product [Darwinula stevensoni]